MRVLALIFLLSGCRATLSLPDLGATPGPYWPPAPDLPYVAYVGEILGPGAGFGRPMDVACGPEGMLAVADPGLGVVWTIDTVEVRWDSVHEIGGTALRSPVGVAYDADGQLLIVDSERALIARDHEKRSDDEVLAEGAPLVRPAGLALMRDGAILVVDPGAHRVFQLNDSLAPEETGPSRGAANEGFNFPVDVAVGADGNVFVCDALNAVVQRMDASGSQHVAGQPGVGGNGLVRPKGIAIDADGRLHVVDAGMQHVQVFSPDGELLGRYAHPGEADGGLSLPAGICIDTQGLIFVADSLHRRVQVYRILEAEEG